MLRLRLFFGLITLILLLLGLGVAALVLMREFTGGNILFVATLVTLGIGVATMMYFELIKHLVDPVVALRRSLGEIRMGNFELKLPEPHRDSEFYDLITAFNEMASELKSWRGESDGNLLRANMLNRAILEAIPSPVFVVRDDNTIIQVNRSAEMLMESLGRREGLPLKIQAILDGCREAQTGFLPQEPKDAILFRVDDQELYYLPRIFRFETGIAAQSGWAVLLHNVSRIRWLDDMKTNLIATISHEIKTPLTGIRMALLLLLEERDRPLSEKQRTLIASASGDCERLLTTLNNLLDLSHVESGATQLERVPTGVQACVKRAVRLFASAAASRGIDFQIEGSDADLPEILADPVRLEEVLNNLISNAIKHSPEGGRIILRSSRADARHVRVSVIDQGPGVPEASEGHIFERFYRAPGQNSQGVGLGLYISREIMAAHEGRIGLRDRTENLTEFYIDVPIA